MGDYRLKPGGSCRDRKDGETQIIRLSENENPEAPEVRENTAPAVFLAHGSVYVWDYNLDNYDENGIIRWKPETTTFDLGEEKSGIRYYAPAAELTEDKSNLYGVGGQAVVMFNYTEEVDKQWFDEITKVALVSGKGYNNTINGDLRYEKKLGSITEIRLDRSLYRWASRISTRTVLITCASPPAERIH